MANTKKSCRQGLLKNLSEKDIEGLKDIYRRIFDLKTKYEDLDLLEAEEPKRSASWLNGSTEMLGKSNCVQPSNESNNFIYPQFEEELAKCIMVDHPDNTLIRYLRARKHSPDLAFKMVYNSVKFLHNHNFHKIIEKGELDLLQYPLESGLFYFCGHDLEGNIIVYLNPRFHRPNESPVDKFSKIMMYVMSLGYSFLGNGKVTGVVDLRGLALSNVEYANVRFAADILANNFPEVLNRILIINSPWIFSGIWSILKTFLDPVVKDKIQFCSQEDLKKFIALDQIPISLGGTNTFEYKYKTPESGKVTTKEKDDGYYLLKDERKELISNFFNVTQEWINGKNVQAERYDLAQKLSENFRALVLYTWSPTYYHRNGIITNFDDVSF